MNGYASDAVEKSPERGHVLIALREQTEALALLEDRLDTLERRLEGVSFKEPRPTAPESAKDYAPPLAPLAVDISMNSSRVLRIQERVNVLIQELQV